jgi:hypothetical protein
MHSDAPDHVIIRSLAQEIASGGDVSLWAERTMVSALVASEWTALPEFGDFVQKCRLEHAEKMVGKMACCVERAIKRLVELSENTRNLSVALAATSAIVKQWVALSVYFVQEQQYWSLEKRVKELKDAQKEERESRF